MDPFREAARWPRVRHSQGHQRMDPLVTKEARPRRAAKGAAPRRAEDVAAPHRAAAAACRREIAARRTAVAAGGPSKYTRVTKAGRSVGISSAVAPSGMARWSRQSSDTYCARFSESPTNIIRLFRSVSSICVGLNLRMQIEERGQFSRGVS